MLESFDQFAMSFGFPIWLFGVLFGFVCSFCGTILKSFEERRGVILVRWWRQFYQMSWQLMYLFEAFLTGWVNFCIIP